MTEARRTPTSRSPTAAEPEQPGAPSAAAEPGSAFVTVVGASASAPVRALAPLLRRRGMRIAAAFVGVLAALLGFLPQLGALAYESALVMGIVLPPVVLLASSAELLDAEEAPFDHYARGLANAAALFAIVLFVDVLHGLRVGFCDPWGGLENWLLGPGLGALLAGAWSAVVAEVARARHARRSLRLVLALALPIGSIALSVWRFYTSPMVHAYDPFVGFFSGTLYDTIVELAGLRSYRLGTLATLGALLVASVVSSRDRRGRLVLREPRRLGFWAVGVSLAASSVAHTALGPRLGHWHSSASIAEALGGRRVVGRCELVYGRGIATREIERLGRDCDAYVEEIEAWLGARGPETIRVFVFESARQKQSFMGAAHTNIAKPWRAEVYVQGTSYPHRVLGHELAHVIAGASARGPFAVAGSLGGLLPDPGLIEGLAVAASPRDEDLSAEQWARAMKELGLLPSLERLFALGFLGENSSTAYTASGAFVSWVRDTHGNEVLRRWYGGEPLEALTGERWAALERRWHEGLDLVELPESARVVAEARFKRPGFFARSCPRAVDACRERSERLADRGDVGGAIAELDRAVALDPKDPRLRLDRAELSAKLGDGTERVAALAAIVADESLPRQFRDQALQARADLALSAGSVEEAAALYEELVPRTLDEAKLRTLHVKLAAARDPVLRPALSALLIDREADPQRVHAYALLGELRSQRPDDGLAWYLIGRARYEAGDWAGASEDLEAALTRRLEIPRVELEALRLAVLSACSAGAPGRARLRLEAYLAHPDARPARKDTLRRLVHRCDRDGAGAAQHP